MILHLILALALPVVVPVPAGATATEIQRLLNQEAKKRIPGQTLELQFAKGRYFIDHAIQVTSADITLVGEPGTTLSGAVTLPAWRSLGPEEGDRIPKGIRKRISVADIPTGIEIGTLSRRGYGLANVLSHSELIIDGKVQTLARYPNLDAEGGGWLRSSVPSPDLTGFVDPSDRPSAWKQVEGAWAYGYWKNDWADGYQPLHHFDEANHEVRFEEMSDPKKGALATFGIGKNRRFYYLNVPEELDQVGEYWIDVEQRKVFAWLPKGATNCSLTTSVEPLVTVVKADGVTLNGLTLEGTRAEAVRVFSSNDFLASDCVVRNVGGDGVVIQGGHHCGLKDVEIYAVGETGASLRGGNYDTLEGAGHFAQNCSIHNVARWCRTYQPGIYAEGVGQRIENCNFSDLPHCAILFAGNDHVIQRNDIQRVCLDTGDAGAIYAGRSPTARGTIIRNNRFRDIESQLATASDGGNVIGVYLDDCLSGIRVVGNVFEMNGMAIALGGGRDNVISGNVFMDPQPAIGFDERGKKDRNADFVGAWGFAKLIEQRPVRSAVWQQHYPALFRDVTKGADLSTAHGNRVAGNVHVGRKWIKYFNDLSQRDLDYVDNQTGLTGLNLFQAIALVPPDYGKIDLGQIGKK